MGPGTALGVFLLGAAVGAVTTAIFYLAQIRSLRNLLETLARKDRSDLPCDAPSSETRKSA